MKKRVLKYFKNDQVESTHMGGSMAVVMRRVARTNFNGVWTGYSHPWLIVERRNSVGVLIHDSFNDMVVLTEQFRPAILECSLEIPAGMFEQGESGSECALREVKEETGLSVANLMLISTFYLSPGITNEKMFLYYAEVASLGATHSIHGVEEEGEEIIKHVVPFCEALEMIDEGLISDAKTTIALRWLQLKRLKQAIRAE